MIPLKLRIAGFLSYRDPVELDFESFDLACISGQNGAGKSSLLDAITWALFGEARGKDKDALVNLQSKAAEVALHFAYEGNVYRVQRTVTRGRTAALEFQIRDGADWRPLTERTARETQARIEQALRLDYDTFVNASFFLQDKADEFTQKKASERKAVLSSILGLEIWETYKERAADRRKEIEKEIAGIDRSIADIDAELAEENARKQKLKSLEAELQQLAAARKTQEAALESIRKAAASLDQELAAEKARLEEERRGLKEQAKVISEQSSVISGLTDQIERAKKSLGEVEEKLAQRGEIEEARNAAREEFATLKAENELRKLEMDELKARIDQLESAEGATCPLCGQELSEKHRQSTLKQLRAEGKEKGDRFRANKSSMDELAKKIAEAEAQIAKLANAERERLALSNSIAQWMERIEAAKNAIQQWEKVGAARLKEVEAILASETYAAEIKKPTVSLDEAERALLELQEQENRKNQEVGAARQLVEVLDSLRARRKGLAAEREEKTQLAARHKTLERAFGKDGVPALLIEQALPQIEAKANDLLDRLSNGTMSIRFATQAEYKDKKREDLKETLDILISDGAGLRDYEMYSIAGSEPVYIRKNGRIFCQSIQSLWENDRETRQDKNYEIQAADCDALCYDNGKAVWIPAQSILRHPSPKEMIKIVLKPGGYSVAVTPNHSIYVITKNGLNVKRGDEIQPGDYVLSPRRIPNGDAQKQIDLLDWISPKFALYRENELKKINFDDTYIWSRIDQSILRFVPNCEQFAELLGLVVAEGSGRDAYTVAAGANAKMAKRVVNLSNRIFGTNRERIGKIPADTIARYMERYEGFSTQSPKTQYRPFIGGRLVSHILGNMVGSGAGQKHIPEFVFNSSKEVKTAFLENLIAGDGYLRIRSDKSQVEIGITTVSPRLVADSIFLCRMLGIWARVEKHASAGFRRGANHLQSYRIAISGGLNTEGLINSHPIRMPNLTSFEGIPIDLIGIVRNTKQKRIKRVDKNERFACGPYVVPLRNQQAYQKLIQFLEDWAVLEVASVEKVQSTSPYVYDLTVPQNHTFVAGTGLILVHNSGGEAFRVNFAIRLALSEVLAGRKGARLQTLIIDEGFGSQDAQGRQRLIEAINTVRGDFAKILVITHLDELKDAFPTRIEVEKTENGSTVRVI